MKGVSASLTWQSSSGFKEPRRRMGRGEVSLKQLTRDVLEADRLRDARHSVKLTVTRINKTTGGVH